MLFECVYRKRDRLRRHRPHRVGPSEEEADEWAGSSSKTVPHDSSDEPGGMSGATTQLPHLTSQ